MQELPPDDEALLGIVAVSKIVDRLEIAIPFHGADARRAERPRFGRGDLHPLGGRGMRRGHVERAAVATTRPAFALAPSLQRRQKARGGVGVIAGMGDHPDADFVGLELLIAREFCDRQVHALRFVLTLVGGREHLLGNLSEKERGPLELRPLCGVMGGDMRDLVRHHRGDLRFVVGKRRANRGSRKCPRTASANALTMGEFRMVTR